MTFQGQEFQPGIAVDCNNVLDQDKPTAQRVHLDCQYGIRGQEPCHIWLLGPNSILAVLLDPLGQGPGIPSANLWNASIDFAPLAVTLREESAMALNKT